MRKRGKKLFCVLASAVLLAGSLGGCRRENGNLEPADQEKDDAIQIGITFDSFVIERWQRDRDVFVSTAQDLGAEVNVQNANGDLQEQIAQINYFIEKKMDVIVIVCIDAGGLTEAVEKAHRAGIPVISYDRLIKNADTDLYISFDNEEVGRLMAEHMTEHLNGGGTILQICGPLEDSNVPMVMDGFAEGISGSGLEISMTEHAAGWLAETGFSVTSSYLGAKEAPDGIMCGNDSIAGQAIRALSERRLAGSVCVVGQDADLDACQRIVEGTQCMTVYKPVERLARRAAERAVEMAAGGMEYQTENGIINDGTYEVPYEYLEPIMVTKENMDEVITGKYHEESDIYLNVKH